MNCTAMLTFTRCRLIWKEYEIVRPEFFAHIKEPALTVNAIARTRAKTDIDLVSEPTKAQLAMILRRLEEQITQTLEVIEK